MPSLFSSTSGHDHYLMVRNNAKHSPIRSYCESLWSLYEPFADHNFSQEFAVQPHQRFWEMYLGVQLINMGCKLQPKRVEEGPDIAFYIGGTKIWVEAIAPGEGKGPDRVPRINEHSKSIYKAIDEDKIILRFTSSLSEKIAKFRRYMDAGVVDTSDVCLIAIGGGAIELHHFDFDDIYPLIVKSVYEIGPLTVTIDVSSEKVVRQGFQQKPEIVKESGSPVPTGIFLDPQYSFIAGILYSSVGLLDIPGSTGDEFIYVHNCVASQRLPKGWMGKGRDFLKGPGDIPQQLENNWFTKYLGRTRYIFKKMIRDAFRLERS